MGRKVRSSKDFLKLVEGYELKPYKDSKGLLTVGVGHLLERDYTPEEVDRMLQDDIRAVRHHLDSYSYWGDLSAARQCVLISLAFNVGVEGFKKFNKMRRALARGDYYSAAEELVNSKRSREDIARWRSKLEYQMMLTGKWPNESFEGI